MQIARVVKGTVAFLGKDAKEFSGHSLRAGFATQAALSGASEWDIQKQTRHKSRKKTRPVAGRHKGRLALGTRGGGESGALLCATQKFK